MRIQPIGYANYKNNTKNNQISKSQNSMSQKNDSVSFGGLGEKILQGAAVAFFSTGALACVATFFGLIAVTNSTQRENIKIKALSNEFVDKQMAIDEATLSNQLNPETSEIKNSSLGRFIAAQNDSTDKMLASSNEATSAYSKTKTIVLPFDKNKTLAQVEAEVKNAINKEAISGSNGNKDKLLTKITFETPGAYSIKTRTLESIKQAHRAKTDSIISESYAEDRLKLVKERLEKLKIKHPQKFNINTKNLKKNINIEFFRRAKV